MSQLQTSSTVKDYHLPRGTYVGHVHLRVANLERAVVFYRDILGFHIHQDMRTEPKPRQVVFLSANDYHRHIALAEFPGITPSTTQQAGLFHIAFLYPNRRELALALKHILDSGYPIDTCHEYGMGEGVNLRDPDGIPLELYYDRSPNDWPRVDGTLRLFNQRIDPATILTELDNGSSASA